MDPTDCRTCGETVFPKAGEIEQSGESYLPAVILDCPKCETVRVEPHPTDRRWRPKPLRRQDQT